MSIFKSIAKFIGKAAPLAALAIPGIGPVAAGAIAAGGKAIGGLGGDKTSLSDILGTGLLSGAGRGLLGKEGLLKMAGSVLHGQGVGPRTGAIKLADLERIAPLALAGLSAIQSSERQGEADARRRAAEAAIASEPAVNLPFVDPLNPYTPRRRLAEVGG